MPACLPAPLHALGQALQSLSAMRRPLTAQNGSARLQAAQVRAASGPGAPQNRQSHWGSSAAARSAVLQGEQHGQERLHSGSWIPSLCAGLWDRRLLSPACNAR